jgi:crotonobetainyl-CoA:carnitine CoA-transferase CaiB-like acyl-CoA transferase
MNTNIPSAAEPLSGIRILAIEQYGAGPFATLLLADLGAEVIKIEHPGQGDIGRHVPPWTGEQDSLFFQSLNRGKKSIELNLKLADGYEVFTRLAEKSDVVFANTRGHSPESLRITFRHLARHNPAIVCTFLTGFGREGPRVNQPAYDYIVQALTGMAALGGEPDGPPARAGVSVVDFSAGMAAAVAILTGLHRARATGEGGDYDTSLFATAFNLTNYVSSWVLSRNYVPERMPRGAHPSIVPSQLFRTSDGWLMVMCQTDGFYRELVARLGLPQLAEDERFATMNGRFENRDELLHVLEVRFSSAGTAHWLNLLEGFVPIAPVNDLAAALEDPQVAAMDLIVRMQHPAFGELQQIAGPIRPPAASAPPKPGPSHGNDTWEVLHEIAGIDSEAFQFLRKQGVTR